MIAKKYKHTYAMTFYKSIIPQELTIGYCRKCYNSISLRVSSVLNVINIETTGRSWDEAQHDDCVAKGTKITSLNYQENHPAF